MAKEDDAAGGSGAKTETGTENKKAQETQGAQSGQGQSAQGQGANVKLDPIELLKADHRTVEQLFQQYETATGRQKNQIVRKVCNELIIHTLLEEEIFYPACRAQAEDEEPLDEAQVEHDSAKMLILDLLSGRDGEFRDAKVKVLSEQIKHHVAEEESAGGIFAKAKSAGVATPELGAELQDRKRELQALGENLPRPRPVALQLQARMGKSQEEEMPRQERDERGRFTSDDDDRRGRSYAARGGGGGGGRSYRDDDDDGRGWYGDSRGHAEAARRGWEGRRGESRSFRDDDDDDRRYSSRGNDRERDERGRFVSDDDDRGYRSSSRYRDRDERGRFTDDDDRGYRSSGRGRDDDDDGRGWYGDSRGHAEAARKGWETRRGERDYDDDDDRRGGYRSRGRDYDDDDDRGRDRGQGGWFGDRRGHAEAARRGWENRR